MLPSAPNTPPFDTTCVRRGQRPVGAGDSSRVPRPGASGVPSRGERRLGVNGSHGRQLPWALSVAAAHPCRAARPAPHTAGLHAPPLTPRTHRPRRPQSEWTAVGSGGSKFEEVRAAGCLAAAAAVRTTHASACTCRSARRVPPAGTALTSAHVPRSNALVTASPRVAPCAARWT